MSSSISSFAIGVLHDVGAFVLSIYEFVSNFVIVSETVFVSLFVSRVGNFAYSILQKYVKAYCNKELPDLLPFDLRKLKQISDDSLVIQKEILVAFAKLSKQDREDAIDFLEKITWFWVKIRSPNIKISCALSRFKWERTFMLL